MKQKILFLLMLAIGALSLPSFNNPNPPAGKIKYSKKADKIIQAKCYGCHSPNGKGEKARMKLNWDELPNLEKAQQVEKLKSIEAVAMDGSMPPKFMVEKDPSKKLTAAESAALQKWAKKTAKKLSK
jgi:cytochrome c553